jgi:hypothetical protein
LLHLTIRTHPDIRSLNAKTDVVEAYVREIRVKSCFHQSPARGSMTPVPIGVEDGRILNASFFAIIWTNACGISMVGFVDDGNSQVNSFFEDDTPVNLLSMVHKAKTNATIWSSLLQTTGGALELSKCSYHVLYWKFSVQVTGATA